MSCNSFDWTYGLRPHSWLQIIRIVYRHRITNKGIKLNKSYDMAGFINYTGSRALEGEEESREAGIMRTERCLASAAPHQPGCYESCTRGTAFHLRVLTKLMVQGLKIIRLSRQAEPIVQKYCNNFQLRLGCLISHDTTHCSHLLYGVQDKSSDLSKIETNIVVIMLIIKSY